MGVCMAKGGMYGIGRCAQQKRGGAREKGGTGRHIRQKGGRCAKEREWPIWRDVYDRRGYAQLVFARHVVGRRCVCVCSELRASTKGS